MTPLRQKFIRDLTIRGKAENTQQVYTACVADLASYYKRSPDLLTYDQVADWLFHLRDERKLAVPPSTSRLARRGSSTGPRSGVTPPSSLPKCHASSARPNAPTPIRSRKSKPFSRLRAAVHVTSPFCARCMAAAYGQWKQRLCAPAAASIAPACRSAWRAKGAKQRVLPMSPHLLHVLEDYWLAERKGRPGHGSPWLFLW